MRALTSHAALIQQLRTKEKTHVLLTALMTMTLLTGVDIWPESPLVRVFPDSPAPNASAAEIRLYAAQGEYESFQLAIRSGRKPLQDLTIQAQALDQSMAPPCLYRVGYLEVAQRPPRSPADQNLWPDPLLQAAPFTLPPEQTATFWITYYVPPEAKPGLHKGKVTLRWAKRRSRSLSVTLQVFDFSLPQAPTLTALSHLDRQAAANLYGLQSTNALDPWKPIYDGFKGFPISISLWDGGNLLPISPKGQADTAPFTQHLAYALTTLHMNAIDLGAGRAGIAPFPNPPQGAIDDPLQTYYLQIAKWLTAQDALDRAIVQPSPLLERPQWQTVRDACFRSRHAGPRIKRILAGPIHPYFERYTDIWAVPLRYFDPHAQTLLAAGRSLSIPKPCPASACTASGSAALPTGAHYQTQPADGYDGSLFSFWLSSGQDPWYQIEFDQPVTASRFRLIWRTGFESTGIAVQLRTPKHIIIKPQIDWAHYPAPVAFGQSWAEATFEKPKTFTSMRLDFPQNSQVAITEILFDDEGSQTEPEKIPPVDTWLYTLANDFPSLAPGAHPVEARMGPWVCWGHHAKGFLLPSLNQWPQEWAAPRTHQPLIWKGASPGQSFLFYPGPQGPIPSIRAMLLRDGLEDYEYLNALAQTDPSGQTRDLLPLRFYPPNPTPQELGQWAQTLDQRKKEIAWALTPQ